MEFFLNLLNLTIPSINLKENHVIICLRVALQSIWETRSLKLSTVNSELKFKTCLIAKPNKHQVMVPSTCRRVDGVLGSFASAGRQEVPQMGLVSLRDLGISGAGIGRSG